MQLIITFIQFCCILALIIFYFVAGPNSQFSLYITPFSIAIAAYFMCKFVKMRILNKTINLHLLISNKHVNFLNKLCTTKTDIINVFKQINNNPAEKVNFKKQLTVLENQVLDLETKIKSLSENSQDLPPVDSYIKQLQQE